MKSSLKIRTADIKVDMQMNNHNFLRWSAIAVDCNPILSKSLIEYSKDNPVLLIDSFYLALHPERIKDLPSNTHIILLDGVNSYFELVQKQVGIASRGDLKFFVVGWLPGVAIEQKIQITPLYPNLAPVVVKDWGALLSFKKKFHTPYPYRVLTTLFAFSRYFKNWLSVPSLHHELVQGGSVVFCGLVTPNEHQVNGFFRGVNAPALLKECLLLTQLNYSDPSSMIGLAAKPIIEAVKTSGLQSATDFACAYSILNVMHRMLTLSILNASKIDLFVNEVRSNHWIDPYDSFFYRNNFYLDFGSTRGPDAIYPRTIDMFMKNKHFTSLRFLTNNLTITEYIADLSYDAFFERCEMDAKSVGLSHLKMFA